jgi:hypothetical protein
MTLGPCNIGDVHLKILDFMVDNRLFLILHSEILRLYAIKY